MKIKLDIDIKKISDKIYSPIKPTIFLFLLES